MGLKKTTFKIDQKMIGVDGRKVVYFFEIFLV